MTDSLPHVVAERRRQAERATQAPGGWPTAEVLAWELDLPPAAAEYIAACTPADTLRRCHHAEGLIEQHTPSSPGNGNRVWCVGHGLESVPWPCRDWIELCEAWGVDTSGLEVDPLS